MERRTFTFEQQKTQLDFIVQGNEFLIWYDTIIIIKVHQNLWDLFQLTNSQTVNKVKKSLRPSPLLKLVAIHLNLRAVLFDVVDDTTTTKFTSRACAVHCNSLPVVVDKVVVVVLKFPKITSATWAFLADARQQEVDCFEIMLWLLGLKRKQKNSLNAFRICIFLLCSYSSGIKGTGSRLSTCSIIK